MQKVKKINHLFSTADAEKIEYSSEADELIVRFVDRQGSHCTVKFEDVKYLTVTNELDEGDFDDGCPYQISGSSLLKRLELDESDFRHYLLCFNTWSNMEIVCHRLKVNTLACLET